MKIVRKNPKRTVPPLPEVATLISLFLSTPDDELSTVLLTVPSWPWPRGDLHSWTQVLNKFDDILEKIIVEYDIKTIQVNEFTPRTKQTVLEILRFEKMLLEHCTNRKIYASFDRLGDLLFTQDLDVLESTLRLLHRPAQQYSSPNHTSELSSNSLIVKRLLSLAQGWGPTREAGFTLARLASEEDDDLELPIELGEVSFQFYRRPGVVDRFAAAKEDQTSPSKVDGTEQSTPTPAGAAAASSSTTPHAPAPSASTSTPSHLNESHHSTPMKPKSKLLSDIKDAFRTPSSGGAPPGTPSSSSTPAAASGPSSSTHEGLTTVVLGNVGKLAGSKSPMDVLADVVEEHSVPEEERFELLNRIRIAMGMGKKDTRRKMLSIRCLALATYSHLVPESNAQTDLFLYEPDMVSHIAELIHSESNIPYNIQTAAIYALDAMSRYRHRLGEVISSINASANHGVLMSLFRSMVVKLTEDKPEPPYEFVEALITFITYLVATAAYSNMLIGAGLVPLLVQLVQNELPSRLPIVVKSINLLDHVVYSNPNGFTIFRNAGGLEALTDRIKSAVDYGVETHGSLMETEQKQDDSPYGILPFPRFSALKALLRSISRMMQTTGTADGLRNLIDSSLPKSVRKIMEYRKVFGSTIFSHALSIMATFVHNEPTSLAVLQEAKLPEAFYDAIEEDIEPSPEVIFGIPNVIGALCLNQAGLDQLAARPTIIPKMIDILTSERHLKILQEKETSHQMGNYCDELIRHHPSLKEPLLNAIIEVLKRLKVLGSKVPADEDSVYAILPKDAVLSKKGEVVVVAEEKKVVEETKEDTSMAVDERSSSSVAVPRSPTLGATNDPEILAIPLIYDPVSGTASRTLPASADPPKSNPTDQEAYVDNLVVLFIGVTARFLEGLFHTQGHCKEFIKADGLALVLDLYTLPAIPYDFAGSGAADALFGLFRAVSDVEPNPVLKALLKPVRASLDETVDFWSTIPATSRLAAMSELPVGPELDAANLFFRRLVCLHGRVALLADMYRGVGFAQSKVATGFLQILNTPEETAVLNDLGKLHRACTWENILIKSAIPAAVVAIIETKTPGSREVARGNANTAIGVPEEVISDLATALPDGASESTVDDSVRTRNGKAFKYLVSQVPASLTPFFQAILKFLMFKRGTDANHKKNAVKIAETVSRILVDHLRWGQDFEVPLDPVSYYAYGTLVVGFTTVLLLDERAMSQGSVQTMLLSSFEYVGGVDALVEVASRYANAFEELDSAETLPARDNVHIFSGLKVTLNLLNTLVSSRALFEAPHTAALTTRDRPATGVEDFDPHRFLVKLRIAILPLIRDIWRSTWLPSAPVSVSRTVVQALLRIMDADLEEKPEPTAGAGAGPGPGGLGPAVPSLPRPPPPADRIQQLVDMGFSAHAATQALNRCHNNTSLAAEFLLSHPGAFAAPPPPPAPAPVEDALALLADGEAAPAPAAEGSVSGSGGDAEMADPPVEGSSSKGKEKEKEEPVVLRWEDRRTELNEARELLRPDLSERALSLADQHEALVFDIKPAFLASVGPIKDLVEETFTLREKALDEESAKVAVRLRLLALILHEGSATIVKDEALVERAMDLVVALASEIPTSTEEGAVGTRPKWLASQLLIVEALFVLSEDIKEVTITSEPTVPSSEEPSSSAVVPPSSIFTGPVFEKARSTFFDQAVQLLQFEDAPREELASTLRLLVLLTRDHTFAIEFAKRDGVALMSRPFKSSKRALSGCQSYIAIIIRHVVEEPKALLALMQQEVKQWFSTPRSKVVDVNHFVKNTKQIALRDPELFIKAVQAECALVQPTSASGAYHINLKAAPIPLKSAEPSTVVVPVPETPFAEGSTTLPPTTEPSNEIHVDDHVVLPSGPDSDVLEAMVHHLLSELMLVGKKAVSTADLIAATAAEAAPKVVEASSSSNETDPVAGGSTSKDSAPASAEPAPSASSAALSDYVYSCLLMQNLTELLGSYMSCKTAFLTMGRRRGGKDSLLTAGKPRTAMLHFIIQDLLCCTSLAEQAPPVQPETKKAMSIANCAMSVLVALCSDVSSGIDLKDVSPELISVRKVVLDAISKAIRDTISSADHIDVRYGRLHSLSDLCYRLLTARASVQPKGHDDGTLHIAKIMLEKNFAVVLTNALAEIDLNYPDVKLVVTDILKPLEHLTKISIKMGRASDKKKDSSKPQDETDDQSEMTSDMDDDEDGSSGDDLGSEGDEETPDLYRNSALGMYGGEMEEGYDDESAGDEDEDMEGYDDMEDMSEGPTESGTESGSDDEEALEDDLIADEGEWEDEDDDGIVDADSDSDGGDEMHFDDDGDEADAHAGLNLIDGDEDDMDDMDEGMGMMEDDDDEDDGGDDGQDDEEEADFENELNQLEADYDMPPPPDNRLTNWGWTQASDRSADPYAASSRRRYLDIDPAEFDPEGGGGRARVPSSVLRQLAEPGQGYAVLPIGGMAGGGGPGAGGGPGTIFGAGGAGEELMATIEGLMGGPGNASRLLEQLMARGGHRGAIQVALPAGALPPGAAAMFGYEPTRGGPAPGRNHRGFDGRTDSRPSSDPFSSQEFVPLPTAQRWLDEERITQGRFVSTRLGKLTNHVVNALLPAAREVARKIKEEDDAAAQEAKKIDEKRKAEAEESMAALRNQVREETLLAESVPLPHSTGPGTPAPEPAQASTEDVEMVDAPAPASTSASASASTPLTLDETFTAAIPTSPAHEEAAAPTAEAASTSSAPAEASTASTSAEASASTSTVIPDQEMDDGSNSSGDEEDDADENENEPEAGPSQAVERVTITIHGEEVDITDTGIDITFLEALPDDMREEVLNQHFRERRPAARPAASAPTQINSEFLDALPADLRAEVLQQEAVEQSRRDREEASRQAREAAAAAGGPPPAQPADIDPASFLASLDPQLREQVLLEQEDGFLQSLPGEMLAGLHLYRPGGGAPGGGAGGRFVRRQDIGRQGGAAAPGGGGEAVAAPAKKPPTRDAIQLLDKSGIASLVRLLFFPEVSRKAIVPRVLVNLCENSKTRAELLNLLLTVVQDGTGDLSAVDKSFAQMTLRGGKANTPKATPKKKGFPETPGPAGLFSHLSAESIPTFIAQRCFDALSQIVSSIERASFFFLTEHDVLVGLKRATTKKGKGKEKQILQTKYPLVVLLGLLDRPSLLKNSSMMDALTGLLVNVTRPLTTLPPPAPSDPSKDGMKDSMMSILSSTLPSSTSTTVPAPATPSNPLATGENPPVAEAGASDPKLPVEESSPVLSHPPQVPNNVLRLVVNVLTVGDCSSVTFKSALTLIHHLSFIPDARDIITAELRSQAQEFGNTLQAELDELSKVLGTAEENSRTVTIAKFTPASSTQAKLLRVLKTLEHIFSAKPVVAPAAEAAAQAPPPAAASAVAVPVPAPAPVPAVAPEAAQPADPAVAATSSSAPAVKEGPTPEQEAMTSVYSSFHFAALWAKLSECLAIVAENESLNDVATVLLPVIEALMVVSRYAGHKPTLDVAQGSLSPRSPSATLEGSEDVFLTFTDTHRKILNDLLRNNPALMSGSFSLLIQNSKVLSFENKRAYFSQQLRRRPNREQHGTLQVNVRRDFVFEDSFSKFQRWSPEQIKYGKLSCRFWDEEGVDAGGVAREWFSVLAKSIFNPNFALFEPSSSGASTYQFNKLSSINPDHLAFFRFVGVVLAKAVQDGRLLDAHFVRSVYRQLLGAKNMGLSDLEIVDPSYHTSLKWMIENPIEDLVELSFSVESDAFGEVKIHDLIPDGRNIAVTDDNKLEYIQKMVNYQLSDSVSDQSKAFIEGFTSIIPQSLLKIYDAGELELLISGLPTIDVDELKNSVQLVHWKNSDPEIVWLWRAIRSYSQAERASFLQFTTGSARVPLGGFSQLVGSTGIQPVQIHKAHGDPDRIPTSHTCFNQLDLGKYSSYEALREKLTLAITEGATGFGFA